MHAKDTVGDMLKVDCSCRPVPFMSGFNRLCLLMELPDCKADCSGQADVFLPLS